MRSPIPAAHLGSFPLCSLWKCTQQAPYLENATSNQITSRLGRHLWVTEITFPSIKLSGLWSGVTWLYNLPDLVAVGLRGEAHDVFWHPGPAVSHGENTNRVLFSERDTCGSPTHTTACRFQQEPLWRILEGSIQTVKVREVGESGMLLQGQDGCRGEHSLVLIGGLF